MSIEKRGSPFFSVECPWCGAPRGEPCRSPADIVVVIHAIRRQRVEARMRNDIIDARERAVRAEKRAAALVERVRLLETGVS